MGLETESVFPRVEQYAGDTQKHSAACSGLTPSNAALQLSALQCVAFRGQNLIFALSLISSEGGAVPWESGPSINF